MLFRSREGRAVSKGGYGAVHRTFCRPQRHQGGAGRRTGILQTEPNVRLMMAGGHRHAGGEELAAYWLPRAFKPYRDRIFFTGWLSPDEISYWYADADILVVPSWYEPFG